MSTATRLYTRRRAVVITALVLAFLALAYTLLGFLLLPWLVERKRSPTR